jgi:hypothetical protein
MRVENKLVINWLNLNYVPGRPLLAPIYRWPGLEDLVGSIQIKVSIYDVISYFDYIYA